MTHVMHGGSTEKYVSVHHGVRFKESHWSDDGTRRTLGQAGNKLKVIAPKESVFFFERRCPWCGGENGEVMESELHFGRAEELLHRSCEKESRERQQIIDNLQYEVDDIISG